MRAINLFILCLFLVSSASAAEKRPVKNAEAISKKVMAEVPVGKPVSWSLAAFPEKDGYLPRNYQGVDPKEFWGFFKEKVSALQKADAETVEEFARRKADLDTVLSPLKASDLYAFWKADILVWYDKVDQSYVFRNKQNEKFCDEASPKWNTCKITTVESSQSTYLGRFPQGATTVKRMTTTDFSLAISKANNIFQSPLVIYDFSRMGFEYSIKMSPVNADKLKGKKMGVLFVGNIAGAEIVAGKGSLSAPTYNDPASVLVQEEAMPFDLKKIVFYVVDTGQILEVKEIQP